MNVPTKYLKLTQGGLYRYLGEDSGDGLTLREGSKCDRSTWKYVGELTPGMEIIVLEKQVQCAISPLVWSSLSQKQRAELGRLDNGNSNHGHIIVDALTVRGRCWFYVLEMCPSWKRDTFLQLG